MTIAVSPRRPVVDQGRRVVPPDSYRQNSVETWRTKAFAIGRTIALQALLLFAAHNAYRLVRQLAEGDRGRAMDHGHDLLRFEQAIGLDVERGVQSIVLGSSTLVDLFNRVYVWSFWPIVTLTLPLLFLVNRRQYKHYRNSLFLSGSVGLVIFGFYPVAPPRMLDGFVDTIHVFSASTELARPGSFTNEFAAMPSFHVGWLVLAGAASMPAIPWRLARPLAMIPALVMTITVMATANHYLIDAVAGAAVTLGALWVSYRLPSAAAVRERIDAFVMPLGGASGVAARTVRGALVGLIALAGGRVALTSRDAAEPTRDSADRELATSSADTASESPDAS